MVAAALSKVRGVADEIVVAVDSRVDPDLLGPLQAVADNVVRAEFEPPLEANLAWLHSLGTGEWILRLDSDDIVSDQLCRRLSRPGWDRGLTHIYLQYRWLVGDGSEMISEAPWWPDPALRLMRNDPGLVTFSDRAHELPTIAGAHQFWDEPIYHLDLVVRSVAQRRAKAQRYERDHPGLRTAEGRSVSSTYYLPEDQPSSPRTERVAPVDAAAINRVLSARADGAPPANRAALGPIVTLDQRRTQPPGPGDLGIRVVGQPVLKLVSGQGSILTLGIENESPRVWNPSDTPPEIVGARFVDENAQQVGFELRQAFPGPVPIGEEVLVRLPVPAEIPEDATALIVGVVQDGVGWYDEQVTVPIQRMKGRRVLVSTGISATAHLGDDLITSEILDSLARFVPDVVPTLLAHPIGTASTRFGCAALTSPVAALASNSGERTRRPRDLLSTARRHATGEPFDDPEVEALLRPFMEADALILAPGGGLASRYSLEALQVFALEVGLARAFSLPVIIEGPSIGPLHTRRDQAYVAELLNSATGVTVRDLPSAEAARRIGRNVKVRVVPDPATAALPADAVDVALARKWLRAHNIHDNRPYIVISMRGGSDGPSQIGAIRSILEGAPPDAALIYLPHCIGDPNGDDLSILEDEWLGQRLTPFDLGLGQRSAVALIEGALCTVGTRLHLSILAGAAGVRAVAITSSDYDRLRLKTLIDFSGLLIVDDRQTDPLHTAIAELLERPEPTPVERWDPLRFASAVDALLPAVDRS